MFLGRCVVVQKFIDGFCKALNVVIALCLAVMVVLVFGNVVMRLSLIHI